MTYVIMGAVLYHHLVFAGCDVSLSSPSDRYVHATDKIYRLMLEKEVPAAWNFNFSSETVILTQTKASFIIKNSKFCQQMLMQFVCVCKKWWLKVCRQSYGNKKCPQGRKRLYEP